MPVTTDAITEFRAQLEEAVAADLPPAARAQRLRRLRGELEHLMGVANTYLADAELEHQGERMRSGEAALIARENADIREEMIRREVATAEQLDAIGLFSHEALDEMAEQGDLDEGVVSAAKGFGLALLRGPEFERMVRRDTGGQFRNKPGTITGRGGRKLKLRPSSGPDTDVNAAQASVLPDRPHGADVTPPKGLVHPARLEAKTPTDDEKKQGVTKKLKGKRGGVKGKEFKVRKTPPVPKKGESDPEVRDEEGDRVNKAPRSRPHFADDAQTIEDRKARGEDVGERYSEGAAAVREKLDAAHKAAAKEKDPAKRKELEAKERELRKELLDAEGKAIPRDVAKKEGVKRIYNKRSEELNKRIEGDVKKAAKKGKLKGNTEAAMSGDDSEVSGDPLSQPEAHFNEAGRVSQRTLLHYANEAASLPTTVERFRNEDGSYEESRAALHARIIDGLMRKRHSNGSLCYTCDYLPAQEQPQVLFTGGGYASGKGGIVKLLDASGKVPADPMLLDPDVIKAELPEFQDAIGTHPEANLLVYQEAWDISQQAQKMAQEQKLNIIVDGISNTSADEMVARIKSFTDAGYENPHIAYVSIPTEESIKRATKRAQEAVDDADRRMIPEVIMRAVHRDVSATIPALMERAKEVGATIEVYENNRGKDETTGDWKPAEKVAEALPDGQVNILNEDIFKNEVLTKATEGIEGIDAPGGEVPVPTGTEAERVPGTAEINIDPKVVQEVGKKIEENLPPVKVPNATQPTRDVDEMLRISRDTGLPNLREFLDEGDGLDSRLGAETFDAGKGGDFMEFAGTVENAEPGKRFVLIGPLKKKERIEDKLEADGATLADGAFDASELSDVTRATVLVTNLEDVPNATADLTAHLEENGWKVKAVKNRLAASDGDPRFKGSGYGDILVKAQDPAGILHEVQINTTQMWHAKEIGPGHDLYDEERSVLETAQKEGRIVTVDGDTDLILTEEEAAKLDEVYAQAKPLYDKAYADSLAPMSSAERTTPQAGEGAGLKEDPALYFKDLDKAEMVPLDKLKFTKEPESQPDSVNTAEERMATAASGETEKRAPISVTDNGDGTYTIEDGNATVGAAKRNGWKAVPVVIAGKYDKDVAKPKRKKKEESNA